MLETPKALENADEILAVEGVDAVFIGPMDLAIASGIAPSFRAEDPRHRSMIEKLLRACQRHGVVPGIYAGSVEMVRVWSEMGFRLLAVSSDSSFLKSGADAMLRELRDVRSDGDASRVGYM
jgi:4-hydroxy-2-oxoheptanedioate aldolase